MQHDLVIDNATYPSVRADINNALQSLGSTSKGSGRPATPYAGQQWLDDNTPSVTTWTWNFYTGSADVKIGEVNTTTNQFMPFMNGVALSSVLGAYAPLNSPGLTGNPTAPTQASGNSSTRIATTAFVQSALAGFTSGVFTKSYISPQQTLTSGGTLTLPHGMGARPLLTPTTLIALNANNGFSVGDELVVHFGAPFGASGASNFGGSLTYDNTNIYITFTTFPNIFSNMTNKATGAGATFTNSDWALVVKAFA